MKPKCFLMRKLGPFTSDNNRVLMLTEPEEDCDGDYRELLADDYEAPFVYVYEDDILGGSAIELIPKQEEVIAHG